MACVKGINIFILCALLVSGTFTEAQELTKINIPDTLSSLPEIRSGKAQLLYCITNEELKQDLISQDSYLNSIVTRIQELDPQAIIDRYVEICIQTQRIQGSKNEIAFLYQKLGDRDSINLEIAAINNRFEFKNYAPDKSNEKKNEPQILLTLRGATVGALAAGAVHITRPALDAFSNKGNGANLTLGNGAAIGALTDIFQQLFDLNKNDEKQRLAWDAGAAGIASLLRTNDPNVIGLAVALTLSQVPAVQKLTTRIANASPQKLGWEIPAMMTGAFILLGNRQNGGPIELMSKNKAGGMFTFGTMASAVSLAKENETAGFIVASFASLLDEACDSLSKKCQGRFDWHDLAANTIGAYFGAKFGGLFFNKDSAGNTSIYLHKKW